MPELSLDKIWMKEVFRNLIENAMKFNPKTPRMIRIAARIAEKRVDITFTDNGPGIPSEEREKIFQKFYQIEGNFTGQVQGMGLGLPLVHRIVTEHGGRVRLESELGQGSTFILELPLS
jgi:signal transduction histidine kinase